jgi:hypothetical protein
MNFSNKMVEARELQLIRRTHANQNQFSPIKEENSCGGCGAC